MRGRLHVVLFPQFKLGIGPRVTTRSRHRARNLSAQVKLGISTSR
ncbi:hypothetical protein Ae505Ps2_6185 [Pseudonocardia sp. Ae505_Ps2]|nr:hypothetical protein Ae505Ps2_6175 [Pseudonocardia sp. Ae505_Ps2]OLM08372.1 hypothetical protein Ae505Ps2_6179 [Pseudonocardia sp. Ae505_Ps2]OLM08375.1 hypothetical protein Ae505Ps2_6182 [Pseudonocardia sp. Ae505_Ps2]OLM08378.1 hypothetical protein Ae505Ps2_6185 [Pseudonocardia sp. Ae505_Ps2]